MGHGLTRRSDKFALTDIRMHDGSRLFSSPPMSVLWHGVRNYIGGLRGADLTGFLCDDVTEAWIDFRYRSHRFTINNQLDEYWLFVTDPGCPDDILHEVAGHFAALLGR